LQRVLIDFMKNQSASLSETSIELGAVITCLVDLLLPHYVFTHMLHYWRTTNPQLTASPAKSSDLFQNHKPQAQLDASLTCEEGCWLRLAPRVARRGPHI
jgi:hypothetical protein